MTAFGGCRTEEMLKRVQHDGLWGLSRGGVATHSMFVNGDLRGKFIMDRNLGARDTKFAADGRGNLYYQFGRKDPFAGGPTGSVNTTTSYSGRSSDVWTIKNHNEKVFIRTTVKTPMTFFYLWRNNWCSEADSENIIWHDYEQDLSGNGKSLFDPSPLGWKVPAYGVWADFNTKVTTCDSDNPGRSYPLADDKFAYYPAVGIRYPNGGYIANMTTHFYMWTSTPADAQQSYYMGVAGSTIPTGGGRCDCDSVRCVQHYE